MIEFPIPRREERVPNPKFVQLLKGAKVYLWDGKDMSDLRTHGKYICSAVGMYSVHHDRTVVVNLMHHIGQSLGMSDPTTDTYTKWVSREFGYNSRELAIATPGVQAARLRWLNQLIEEFGGVL